MPNARSSSTTSHKSRPQRSAKKAARAALIGISAEALKSHKPSSATAVKPDLFPISRVQRALRYAVPFLRKAAPWWWEFESELKRRLSLELLLRKLFSMVPKVA